MSGPRARVEGRHGGGERKAARKEARRASLAPRPLPVCRRASAEQRRPIHHRPIETAGGRRRSHTALDFMFSAAVLHREIIFPSPPLFSGDGRRARSEGEIFSFEEKLMISLANAARMNNS